MKPTLFLIIHGVEADHLSDTYASDFIEKIEKKITDTSNLSIRPINWAKLVEARQKQMYERLSANHRWWLKPILKLMCSVLADVLWYLLVMMGKDKSELEQAIEGMVRNEIDVFRKNHPDGLIIIGGHSLGSQIGLKLCYDSLNIHGLITWGTFCYYLSGAYPDWGHPPAIKFWVNFYNPADPVATEMMENDNFKNFVTIVPITDIWNLTPIRAHTMYWKSDQMIQTIADILQKQ